MTILECKKLMRKELKIQLSQLYKETDLQKKESLILCHKIEQIPQFQQAELVLLYIPYGFEADCIPLVKSSYNLGKKVFVPKVVPGTCNMEFYRLEGDISLEKQLVPGAFGIQEPVPSLKKLELTSENLKSKKVFVLVPGLAFTEDGKRLGKGMGFYDRYIPRLKESGVKLTTCGFGYGLQLLEDLPVDEFDCRLDLVIC